MIKKRLLLSLAIALSFQAFLLSSCSNNIANPNKPKKTEPLGVANSAGIPTYVFYYAQWCGFCHKMAPNVKKAAEAFKDRIFFYYVDIDTEEGKAFSSKYRPGGRGVPFAQYYDAEGNYTGQKIGLISYQELERSLNNLLK